VTERVLVGGTASGKKTVAAALARAFGLTVLSMDSMKVYRGMDIGTAKPSAALRDEIDYELLDLVGHDAPFSTGRWLEAAIEAHAAASRPTLFAGGTPLYLRILLRGLFPGPPADPDVRAALDRLWDEQGEAGLRAELARGDPEIEARLFPGDKRRLIRALEVFRVSGRPLSAWQRDETLPPFGDQLSVCALRHEPAEHLRRIEVRAAAMIDAGLVDEVAALRARAAFAAEPGRAIGYTEALARLDGSLDDAQMLERMVIRTRQMTRKQRQFITSHAEVTWVDVPAHADDRAMVLVAEQVAEVLDLG